MFDDLTQKYHHSMQDQILHPAQPTRSQHSFTSEYQQEILESAANFSSVENMWIDREGVK